MTMFKYQGPADSSVTLKVDGQDLDVVLFRGQTVDLPEKHDYVQTLVALGHLKPAAPSAPGKGAAVEAAAPAAESETAKKGAK